MSNAKIAPTSKPNPACSVAGRSRPWNCAMAAPCRLMQIAMSMLAPTTENQSSIVPRSPKSTAAAARTTSEAVHRPSP